MTKLKKKKTYLDAFSSSASAGADLQGGIYRTLERHLQVPLDAPTTKPRTRPPNAARIGLQFHVNPLRTPSAGAARGIKIFFYSKRQLQLPFEPK